MTPVRLEPATPGSRVKHSTTEPLRYQECKVACFQFICSMVVLSIFLFYIWAQIEIDCDLISCDIFIFQPRVTSSGHSLLKSRDHRVKMWINERSEFVRG